jgi:hypothetical protein
MATAKSTTLKTRFEKELSLTSKGIIAKRAAIINRTAFKAQLKFQTACQDRVDDLDISLLNLEDFSTNSTMSTEVVKKDWDANHWAQNMQSVKVNLEIAKQELKIAEETLSEWF